MIGGASGFGALGGESFGVVAFSPGLALAGLAASASSPLASLETLQEELSPSNRASPTEALQPRPCV